MDNKQIQKIKTLKGKLTDTQIRREIRKLGYKKTAANNWFNKIFASLPSPGVSVRELDINTLPQTQASFTYSNDAGVAESTTSNIRTIEDLIRVCDIDTNIWECIKFVGNSYGENFQAKGEFKRKVSVETNQIIIDLKADLLNYSPNKKQYNYSIDPSLESVMLEVCAFDLHLGKLGWKPSDGGDFDISIAKERFKESIADIVYSARSYNIEKILFPVGNDYLTIDNEQNTTTKFTPQSVDSRFPKIFKEGRELLVWAIDFLSTVAPVDVIVVAGNHETNSMHHIGDSLECWYKNDKNVSIDNLPSPRKYRKYGDVLIGYDHGDKIKIAKLPMIMASECEYWSKCSHREIHIGHLHHERAVATEDGSCIVRIIPALSGNDNYHNTHGYIGSKQRAQGFVWNKDSGLCSILYSRSYK
jgi:hypothetical protein